VRSVATPMEMATGTPIRNRMMSDPKSTSMCQASRGA
jgi:hypothetical protein